VVTVTGIRRGIASAITDKKNNDGVVEAISAEDVGKLPDNTVADAISRLPGLATQRNRSTGRSQNVSVRGLSPDFNAATLNGREQASTGDSRGVEFDQFPAELLSGVDVYKTPKASLVNQGLASTIDLKTVRPLDFGKRVFQGSYRKEKTGIDSGAGEGDGERHALVHRSVRRPQARHCTGFHTAQGQGRRAAEVQRLGRLGARSDRLHEHLQQRWYLHRFAGHCQGAGRLHL
jgi:iron complex outermembrane receptor protein